jgi:hypothetical protein
MSVLRNRPARRNLKPSHGTARWLQPMPFLGKGVLEINGTAYTVERLHNFDDDAGPRPVGFRLTKEDGTVYDISTDRPYGWECDCPDGTYNSERPGGCKHIASLKAALAQLQPVPAA